VIDHGVVIIHSESGAEHILISEWAKRGYVFMLSDVGEDIVPGAVDDRQDKVLEQSISSSSSTTSFASTLCSMDLRSRPHLDVMAVPFEEFVTTSIRAIGESNDVFKQYIELVLSLRGGCSIIVAPMEAYRKQALSLPILCHGRLREVPEWLHDRALEGLKRIR